MEQTIPHIHSLMQPTLADAISQAETVVVAKPCSDAEYQELMTLLQPDQVLVDLIRLDGSASLPVDGSYHGIAW